MIEERSYRKIRDDPYDDPSDSPEEDPFESKQNRRNRSPMPPCYKETLMSRCAKSFFD